MSVFSPAESTSVVSCGNTPCTRRRRNNLSPALLLLAEAPEIKGGRPRPEAQPSLSSGIWQRRPRDLKGAETKPKLLLQPPTQSQP